MKVHIQTKEHVTSSLFGGKKAEYTITCSIEFTPEEARIFPKCGTPVRELTPIYTYHDDARTQPVVMMLNHAVDGQATFSVPNLGQLQESERSIISRCLEVQELLTGLLDFEIEKSYVVDLTAVT